MKRVLLIIAVIATSFAHSTAGSFAVTVDFGGNNALSNLNQTGTVTPDPYVASPSGGINNSGSVIGYSGNEYRATAVYSKATADLTSPGASVNQSIDIFYNAAFHPLAPGANGVRSFRLGVVDSAYSAFETFGNSASYIDGVYALNTNQMLLVGRNTTNNVLTSLTLSEVSLTANEWYRVESSITNVGNNQVRLSGSFFEIGSDGTSSPVSLSTWDYTFQNGSAADLASAYAGFSVLADGGISKADNFSIDGFASAVPEPSTWVAMMLGFAGLMLIGFRRNYVAVPRNH